MIKVGINENVVLAKTEILVENSKHTLAITFREKADEAKVEVSAYEALGAEGYTDTGDGSTLTLRLFNPLAPFEKKADGTVISPEDRMKQASESIAEKKNLLFQILCVYMTSDKASISTDNMYKGTGINAKNFPTKILEEEVLAKIMFNLSENFCSKMKPFEDKDELAVRLLLVRRSVTKHFADLRNKFVKDNPVIESMQIPLESSKLAFTSYEKSKGLDSAEVIRQSEADQEAEEEEEMSVQKVFGKKAK